jgi:predicted nucleic acid-binding protein
VLRDARELPFLETAADLPKALLYDTTVYVDILQGRFPIAGELALRGARAWHSTVTDAELIAPCGLLDPKHRQTAAVVKQILQVIDRRPAYRTIAPDREIWLEAGVLAGILARLQGYGASEPRRLLNDALIFATARKHGLTVLTRNIGDFDFLQQLEPSGRVLFYRQR